MTFKVKEILSEAHRYPLEHLPPCEHVRTAVHIVAVQHTEA
jgi:hypothetical protein